LGLLRSATAELIAPVAGIQAQGRDDVALGQSRREQALMAV
jgi:hypothetical protein